jgi:hypothetical protein
MFTNLAIERGPHIVPISSSHHDLGFHKEFFHHLAHEKRVTFIGPVEDTARPPCFLPLQVLERREVPGGSGVVLVLNML